MVFIFMIMDIVVKPEYQRMGIEVQLYICFWNILREKYVCWKSC